MLASNTNTLKQGLLVNPVAHEPVVVTEATVVYPEQVEAEPTAKKKTTRSSCCDACSDGCYCFYYADGSTTGNTTVIVTDSNNSTNTSCCLIDCCPPCPTSGNSITVDNCCCPCSQVCQGLGGMAECFSACLGELARMDCNCDCECPDLS